MLGSRVGVLANAVGKQVKTSRFTNAVHWQLRCWCSYYSPESILTRLNRPRRASKSGKPSRSKPPKSEEEVWMEAGAPGYFDNSNDPLEAPRQTQNLPAAAEDQQSTQHEDVFAHGVAPSFDSSEGQTTTAHQPIGALFFLVAYILLTGTHCLGLRAHSEILHHQPQTRRRIKIPCCV